MESSPSSTFNPRKHSSHDSKQTQIKKNTHTHSKQKQKKHYALYLDFIFLCLPPMKKKEEEREPEPEPISEKTKQKASKKPFQDREGNLYWRRSRTHDESNHGRQSWALPMKRWRLLSPFHFHDLNAFLFRSISNSPI